MGNNGLRATKQWHLQGYPVHYLFPFSQDSLSLGLALDLFPFFHSTNRHAAFMSRSFFYIQRSGAFSISFSFPFTTPTLSS
jgi:hypothetical protein